MCKTLHVLPREGGVLDQPANEIRKLETVLHSFSRYEELEAKRKNTRSKNRERHSPDVERTIEE